MHSAVYGSWTVAFNTHHVHVAAPWWLSRKEACQCRQRGFDPWVGKIPLENEMTTHSSILGLPRWHQWGLGNPTDRGAWWATIQGVAKSQTRLSN